MKNPSFANRQAARGFTLIEILTVMTIIAILAAISITGFEAMNKASERKATEARLALIKTKLQEYKLDRGGFPGPATGDEDSSQILYQALAGRSESGVKQGKTYIPELAQENKGWTDGKTILDKSGNPLRYRVADPDADPGDDKTVNPDYDLRSVGPDGKTDEQNPDAEVNVDDLRNF